MKSKWYEKLWIYNFIQELRVWREIRKVYRKNRNEFLKIGLKSDWFGKLYLVINRDTKVELGSSEDEMLLHDELMKINSFLLKMNILDILAYEMKPLEEDDGETYEHGYLLLFTPAYRLDKQYVSFKSVFLLFIMLIVLLYVIVLLSL